MYRRSRAALLRSINHLARRLARTDIKQKLVRRARAMWPMLVTLAFASVAHAQGTMDFSGATTLMQTFKTFAIYAGAVICFGGLIFAGIRMMSGRFQDAIPGLFGALFGAGVLGWGAGWIGSLTGQSM
ncbi:TrbC/VirB2 family protein [Edaphobacter sp. HDX4]|uniref:TrbC/VirB2 family protein n=1 Tax=Edaphobacter sp. HDX4 TaxID=2794064 RepID=UPI002FE64107